MGYVPPTWPLLSGWIELVRNSEREQLGDASILFMLTSAPFRRSSSTISSASLRLAAIMSGVQPEPSYRASFSSFGIPLGTLRLGLHTCASTSKSLVCTNSETIGRWL